MPASKSAYRDQPTPQRSPHNRSPCDGPDHDRPPGDHHHGDNRRTGRVVAEQASAASSAAASAGQASAPVSVHSTPVDDQGTIVAVAAFSYSATGKPVEVLSYGGGRWSIAATIGADLGPPSQPLGNTHLLALDTGLPVSVADVTGDGRPDFLILLQAASTTPAVVVSRRRRSMAVRPQHRTVPDLRCRKREPTVPRWTARFHLRQLRPGLRQWARRGDHMDLPALQGCVLGTRPAGFGSVVGGSQRNLRVGVPISDSNLPARSNGFLGARFTRRLAFEVESVGTDATDK